MINFKVSFSQYNDYFNVKFDSQDPTSFEVKFSGDVRYDLGEANVYVLQDEVGNEVYAVLVGDEELLDATSDDIRLGKTAVTEGGITVGEKVIPSYHTTEGYKLILPNKEMVISLNNSDNTLELYNYTKIQIIVCEFNGSLSKSTFGTHYSVGDFIYKVNTNIDGKTFEMIEDADGNTSIILTSTINADVIWNITKIAEKGTVNLGFVNDTTKPCVIRFITYKEI